MISSALRRSLAAHSGYASRPGLFTRQLHTTARRYPRKDAQDKDSLAPDSNEYSKSAGDDKSAQIDKTAFDPKKTNPEEQYASAADEGPQEKVSGRRMAASGCVRMQRISMGQTADVSARRT